MKFHRFVAASTAAIFLGALALLNIGPLSVGAAQAQCPAGGGGGGTPGPTSTASPSVKPSPGPSTPRPSGSASASPSVSPSGSPSASSTASPSASPTGPLPIPIPTIQPQRAGAEQLQTPTPSGSPSGIPSPRPSGSVSPTPTPRPDRGPACRSSISINFKTVERGGTPVSRWSGRVSSPANECEPGRRVTLFKEREGRDKVVDRTVSKRRGRWLIIAKQEPGRFYAKVLRSTAVVSGQKATCKPARSVIQPVVRG